MKSRILMCIMVLIFFATVPTALASTTWYVDGVNGSDSNKCKSSTSACKSIGHAISLASSGDTIMIAAATYKENLSISKSLNIIGFGASTTIIDGGGVNCPARLSITSCRVVTISPATTATLSGLTIRNGSARYSKVGSSGDGGGIYNSDGTLTINSSTVTGNVANGKKCILILNRPRCYGGNGGGIYSRGTLTINNSTFSGNVTMIPMTMIPTCCREQCFAGGGGGIFFSGTLTINNSTISGNTASGNSSYLVPNGLPFGGGISNNGTLTISNSTISGNSADNGGGITGGDGTVKIQNSIVANNTGGNCSGGTMTSHGHNLSSDNTCNFNGPGDMNNTNPLLGPLQNNGGATQTQALLFGSPAIDAGNPSGCTDGSGHLLKTDQRGKPRPDAEDSSGCDIGAYERHQD